MFWSRKSKENHKQCNTNFVLLVPGNVFLAQFSLAPAPDCTRTNEVSALDVVQPTSVGHPCGNVTIVSDLF